MENETPLHSNSKDQELGHHPCVNMHQEKLYQLALNYVKLKYVSCTSNLLARTCDLRKCTEFLLMLILSLQGLLQHQNLEMFTICIVVLCFAHDNVVRIHMSDECMGSNVLSVCRMLSSIL